MPRPGVIKRWCCLTSVSLSVVCLSRTSGRRAACAAGPAGWRVLADWAWLDQPGSRLPLHASVAGLGGGILWRPRTQLVSQDQDGRAWGEQVCAMWYFLSSMLWHCWLGDGTGIRPVKSLLAVMELCTSCSSSCHHHLYHPSVKSRMVAFWRRITRAVLENRH